MLVRELLSGDQDLTWSDSGTPEVVRIWRVLGGDIDHTRTCDWMLVLRPGRWLRALSAATVSRRRWLGPDVVPVRGLPLPARSRDAAEPPTGELASEEVAIADLAAELPGMSRKVRLRVDHDETSLEYLFSYLASLGLGDEIVRRLVRRGGRAIGWFAYLARPTVARVIHLGAGANEAEAVTSALVEHARGRGVAALSGRLEPHLDEPMRRRGALLALCGQPLVHSRDPALLAAVCSSASLLTEIDLIDSEWW